MILYPFGNAGPECRITMEAPTVGTNLGPVPGLRPLVAVKGTVASAPTGQQKATVVAGECLSFGQAS